MNHDRWRILEVRATDLMAHASLISHLLILNLDLGGQLRHLVG